MDEITRIEKMLEHIDFSRGHKHAVWDKIRSRLYAEGSLPLDELDNAAGGLSRQPDIGALKPDIDDNKRT